MVIFSAFLACVAPAEQVSFTLTGPELLPPRDNQRLWVEVLAPVQAAITLRLLVPLQHLDSTEAVEVTLLEDARIPFAQDTLTDRVTLEGLRSLTCTETCLFPYDLRIDGAGGGSVDWEVQLWAQWSLATEDDLAPLISAWTTTDDDTAAE